MHTVTITPVIERLVHTYLRRHPASVCVGSIDNLTECVEQIHHIIRKLILKRMKNSGKESVDVSKYLIGSMLTMS
ncbi:unnamed protein product [Rotaria sp. Silwood1]|nr:unnamed protein product [Rotaria sp. Silwood1]CAF3809939.1 unnamed protein product [Rotaria sp. Silwood1]CAF4745473.1 unnamed protein product [Rotaria sp. Silwood1]CAF4771353.1 unnamed protein product [Rotaria sp. Silwood1]